MADTLIPTISGQELIDLVNSRIRASTNAFDPEDILGFINDAANETWKILRSIREDYFETFSQNTISTDDDYFGLLSTTVREYSLPRNYQEIRFIEVLDSGHEGVEFRPKDHSSTEFQNRRRTSTALGEGTARSDYFYDIIGARTLMLSQFPEITFNLRIWYIRSLVRLDVDSQLDEILYPYSDDMAKYAAHLATLSLRDETLSDRWLKIWKDSVHRTETVARMRQSSGPVFVDDFLGGTSN